MMTFDPNNTSRDTRFDRELARLRALVDDMEAIRSGIHPERLAGAAPILDTWVLVNGGAKPGHWAAQK